MKFCAVFELLWSSLDHTAPDKHVAFVALYPDVYTHITEVHGATDETSQSRACMNFEADGAARVMNENTHPNHLCGCPFCLVTFSPSVIEEQEEGRRKRP